MGERGKQQADDLEWEMKLCERFLPKGLSADELRAAVRVTRHRHHGSDRSQAGGPCGG